MLLALDVAYLVLSHGPLLTWFAYRFRTEDPPHRSDAIVVLIGGLDRAAQAAALYRGGLGSVILMGRTKPTRYDETEEHRQALVQGGVPAEAITILPGELVRNTHDEAMRVREYVNDHAISSVTLVTTAYHSARARWTFERVLRGSGVAVRMSPSRDPRFSEDDWYTRDDGFDLYVREAMKTIYYRLVY